MTNKSKIYLSSKMTGLGDYGVSNFDREEKYLKSLGFKNIVNPSCIGKKYGYNRSYAFYLKEAIKMLLTCDTIYLFGNWENSKGAQLERSIAKALNMEIVEASVKPHQGEF